LDYKTGASKAKLSKEDKKQLLIYQLAARELFREPVQRLTYHYLESGEKASFLGTDSELKETEEKVKTTIEEIKKSDFHPTPSKLCEWCDFKSVCEYRQI